MIEPDALHHKLSQAFPGADIELVDLTGTKDHYQARIVSSAFEGRSLVEQHQLVYQALEAEMKGPVHALALKTYTPASWVQKSASS